MTTARLRDLAFRRDADRFVGRSDALAQLERLLDPDDELRMVLVHGAGGIGKSALLREFQRRATAAGLNVSTFDGRTLPQLADQLARAIEPPRSSRRPLVMIDEVEALGIGLDALREILLESLPAGARLVIAGRLAPDRSWLAYALDGLAIDLPLRPLDRDESREVLRRRGVGDADQQDATLDWAQGFPLALALAATRTSTEGPKPTDLEALLIRHLAGTEIDGVDRDLLIVAALSWAVDSRLIAAALPGRNTRGDVAALLGLSFTQGLGHRVALHPLLAQSVRTMLRSRDPVRYRTLKVRIADDLAARAHAGDIAALSDLAELIDDPETRRWMSRGASATHYGDSLRDGDLEAVAARLGRGGVDWATHLASVTTGALAYTTSVRRSNGGLAAVAVHVPGATLDPSSHDPLVAAIAADIAERAIDPALVLAGIGTVIMDSQDAEDAREAMRVGIPASIRRAGVANLRYVYAPEWTGDPAPSGFFSQVGFEPVERVSGLEADGFAVRLWVRDFGPGGLVTFYHSIVRIENGESPVMAADGAELLRDLTAARDADGDDVDSGRSALRDRLAAVFGTGAEDRRLRAVLEASYLDGPVPESTLLERLHLSRSTYYRQLRAARHRLVAAELRPDRD